MPDENKARENIDRLLAAAGWRVCDVDQADLQASRGVAIREFPLKPGHGFADYLLYVDRKAAGVLEAKPEGFTLTGVETQSDKYTKGLPDTLPSWENPLPFSYQSTGTETRFTNGLDPEPRSRNVFAFHKPETLAAWLVDFVTPSPLVGEGWGEGAALKAADALGNATRLGTGVSAGRYDASPGTFLARMQSLPPLVEADLWPAQIIAIKNLEASLAANKPRSLIQMATGSGKTYTAISFIYRLIKFARAQRVLFLVDRGNLGDQTLKEFQQYVSPYNNYKFTEEYIVQRLTSNKLDTTARVCICTIQRLYSMLKGRELADEDDDASVEGLEKVFKDVPPIEYNPKIPIETFDIIVTDECHRSIYNLWAQVLEYFDAYLIGLTATPSKQTFGFFHRNLVMEYPHEQAVADGVNVNYDVYRIRTQIGEAGSRVEAGYFVEKQERETRARRWEQLDEDLAYEANQLDRDVVAPDQIRTVVRTFRDRLFADLFPGRTWVPKTLIFAKDDAHAENIVQIVREEFGRGNDFCQKITYRTTGADPKELIKLFRNSPMPRIAVTVDMIATGTDIKPVEVVMFMRRVASRSFFEQMKGRGVRVIEPDDLKAVTPDAPVKDHFVIVDAVGVCEAEKTDSRPMEKKPSVSFEKLLQAVAFGNTESDVLSSVAARIARMEHRTALQDEARIRAASGGLGLRDLSRAIVRALDPDAFPPSPLAGEGRGEGAVTQARQEAVKPLLDPKLRDLLIEIKRKNEITIDHVSQDSVIEAGFSADALARARGIVQSFERFIEEHKDEITALQVLYSRPYRQRLKFEDIKDLAERLNAPPHLWTESQLWQAYAALEKDKVKGASGRRILTDLVSLVRFAMHQENELVPYPERVAANFKAWLAHHQSTPSPLAGEGRGEGAIFPPPLQGEGQGGDGVQRPRFTPEQLKWLEMIRDHIAANLGIEIEDFEYAPFNKEGGIGRVHQLFGAELPTMLALLNNTLAA
ncbi:MAG: DEAD/DEAH box helicase family protein [Betaproteobacteria bacterium]|nr:DEAD/DEAH box helicase family protein [Betaproteobacteria bacterium]